VLLAVAHTWRELARQARAQWDIGQSVRARRRVKTRSALPPSDT
jgi:hypothetical protein